MRPSREPEGESLTMKGTTMIELSEFLRAAAQQSRADQEARKSPPDVLCTTLRELTDRYTAPCPFKVGDLVTPRADSDYVGEGEPQVVLEVLETPIRNFVTHDSKDSVHSQAFGLRLDVRVGCEADGCLVAFWKESWKLEPYTGPGSEPEQKAA